MSSAVITCPNCRVRLKVAAPKDEDESYSCPKCGQVVVVAATPASPAPRLTAILLALIGAVILLGAGIGSVLLITRIAPPDTTAPHTTAPDTAPLRLSETENLPEPANEQPRITKPDETPQRKEADKRPEESKLQDDLKKLLAQGDEALGNKQFAAALEIFKLVLQKNPGDEHLAKKLIAAQEGLARDQVERKKQEDFQAHLTAGQAALQSGRYAAAAGQFVAAQLILPKSVQAAALRREAERRLAIEKNRKDQKAEYDRLMDLAGASLRGQRYDDAAQSYKKALQIMPDDPSAAKGLEEARQALKNAALQFDILMAQGANAMRDARFQDAVEAFREASRLSPASESAAQALRVAVAAFENRASYVVAMRRGNLALSNLLFEAAIAAFSDALRLVPNDPLAAAGLVGARNGLADAVRRRGEWDMLIKAGSAAAKQRNHAEAARAFKNALKLLPGHPQADTIRVLFRYNDHMAEGATALSARRYQDAIRHFQAALVEIPNDAGAVAALNHVRMLNAKSGKKGTADKKGP